MHMNYKQPTKSKVHVPQVYSHCTQIRCSNLTFRLTTTTTCVCVLSRTENSNSKKKQDGGEISMPVHQPNSQIRQEILDKIADSSTWVYRYWKLNT